MSTAVKTVIKDPEPPKKRFNPTFLKGYYQPMTKEQLLDDWANKWSEEILARDTLLEAMRKRDLQPTDWTTEREMQTGLYPNIADPDFAARLFRKTEFSDLRSTAVPEDICVAQEGFDTTPVQRLVARFLHPQTPYRSLLLDHGVGVGKTCSAITVAETFLEGMPQNRVTILCPQAIASGFRRTIFDAERLTRLPEREAVLRGEVWESQQCTGMTYPRLTGTANETDVAVVEKAVEAAISKRYFIKGYLSFANWITGLFKQLPKSLEGKAREEAEDKILHDLFSDHLIIVDEAHNLRDIEGSSGRKGVAVEVAAAAEVTETNEAAEVAEVAEATDDTDSPLVNAAADAAAGKRLTPLLRRILRVSEGLRLMMMTATPMYNTAPEILFLLNLLVLNDTKDEGQLLKQKDFFNADGALYPKGEAPLRTLCGRYMSFMRGENPASFPLRLTPPEATGEAFLKQYPKTSISKMEKTVKMSANIKKILGTLPLILHRPDIQRTAVGRVLYRVLGAARGQVIPEDEGSEVSNFLLDQAMQIANITFPDGSYGSRGWDTYWREAQGPARLRQFIWSAPADEDDPDYTPAVDDVFGARALAGHAPKIAAIVESLTKAQGICFAFSRYVKAGALPLAIALERAGWTRVLGDGTAVPLLRPDPKTHPAVSRQCALCVQKEGGRHVGHTFTPANFILLTGDDGLTPDFKGALRYANTLRSDLDTAGGKVKAILGSQIAAEGLDLKCVRENHLLDGWYHLNRIEQVIGRAVRYCSHAALPKDKQNCLIYLHVVMIPDYETADLYAYRLAARKAIPIGQVQRIIKTSAWDCLMNRDAILLKGLQPRRVTDAQGRVVEDYDPHDKPYTSVCDYQERCEYVCTAKTVPEWESAPNVSTYGAADARRRFLQKQGLLRKLFAEEIAFPLDFIRKTVYGDMPWEIASIGLREVLRNPQFTLQRADGIRGTLRLLNGYLVFHPLGVTDEPIPMALRYGRAFGRLPRTMMPSRGAVLQTEAPRRPVTPAALKDATAPAAAAAAEGDDAAAVAPKAAAATAAATKPSPMQSLHAWEAVLAKVLSQSLLDDIAPPSGIPKNYFEGWRWIFHQFAALPETPQIAKQWWMDTEWGLSDREKMVSDWVVRGSLTPEEDALATGFRPVEMFQGADMRGYQTVDVEKNKVLTYCFMEGDTAPAICPSNMLKDVTTLVGLPVDRMKDTGPIFGFLISKQGNILFKTVNKADIKSEKDLRGALCSNTSNLGNHELRIKIIQDQLRAYLTEDHPILSAILDDSAAGKPSEDVRKKRQASKELKHLHDMSLKQSCPYMEFLLRWMDMHRLGGKRWFLSVLDSARAGVKFT